MNGAFPFIKCAGGKRQLVPEIMAAMPKFTGRYFEPFVGGGALFFALRPTMSVLGHVPKRVVLSDTNERLIRTYKAIQRNVNDVIDELKTYAHDHDEKFFYKVRAKPIDKCADAEVAAWFIYLNKTCFNGIYRVNMKNQFNVPFGRYMNPLICDDINLRACSVALQEVEIVYNDFEKVLFDAQTGDFVYCDPPYVPVNAPATTKSFTGYSPGGFTLNDQKRLRDIASLMMRRGVKILLSNSSSPQVKKLYTADFWKLFPVQARRSVNSKVAGRGNVKEYLISPCTR